MRTANEQGRVARGERQMSGGALACGHPITARGRADIHGSYEGKAEGRRLRKFEISNLGFEIRLRQGSRETEIEQRRVRNPVARGERWTEPKESGQPGRRH